MDGAAVTKAHRTREAHTCVLRLVKRHAESYAPCLSADSVSGMNVDGRPIGGEWNAMGRS